MPLLINCLKTPTGEGHFFALGAWESEGALRRHLEANQANIADSAAFLEGETQLTILNAVPRAAE